MIQSSNNVYNRAFALRWGLGKSAIVPQFLFTWPDGICGASHVQSAVDSPYLSGDVGGGIGGKEMYDARDLVPGPAMPPVNNYHSFSGNILLV